MNEKLLQYLWNFKIFTSFDFLDTNGNFLEILDFGTWNFNSGPDFLLGKIKTSEGIFVGHIELHVKSSDWIFHRHSGNPEFKNLIAHVVYIHDLEIEEFTENGIPTIALKDFIDHQILVKYESLLQQTDFIACEKTFRPELISFAFHHENLLKKLDDKSVELEADLSRYQNDFEAVFFQKLAYAFGLKVNASIFRQLAETVPFSIVNKIRTQPGQLEALFFGLCNWLEKPLDNQTQEWKREYDFLKNKHQLGTSSVIPKFSKLRPPSFPTIRLSQLAMLYQHNQHLFSRLIVHGNLTEIKSIFKEIKASSYWDSHFNFGKTSTVDGVKRLTEDFISLVLINAVFPMRYTYFKNHDEFLIDDLVALYESTEPEKNTIIDHWKTLGVPVKNSLESQSLLYHYRQKCLTKDCLNCSIGLQLLKNTH